LGDNGTARTSRTFAAFDLHAESLALAVPAAVPPVAADVRAADHLDSRDADNSRYRDP
jgi:hypothetical protein